MLPPARDPDGSYRLCLVCLGNICRSPMAEVVLRAAAAKGGIGELVTIDSAGTGDWHIGQGMNRGALAALKRRGYDGSAHRARQIGPEWLGEKDILLAMDRSNEAVLLAMGADRSRVLLFAEAGGLAEPDIPDPYGGPPEEFDYVLALIESAAPAIITAVATRTA